MQPKSLADVLDNIKDPRRWADFEALVQVMTEVPSVRGMVYGNVAEVEFADWLVRNGVPMEDQFRDDDHAKTKSDRTIVFEGRRYTIQVKSLQTNSIKEWSPGRFSARVQCDASDRRTVVLSTGTKVETTCYVAGEFDVLCVGLHPFLGAWEFAFQLNSSLARSNHRGGLAKHLTDDERGELLKTLVPLEWPLADGGPWTRDLFGLLRDAPDLGAAVERSDHETVVRLPGLEREVTIEDD
jgi:hypothetical protein